MGACSVAGERDEAVDESVWGKSRGLEAPYPLVRHLLDTAGMALWLWDHYLSVNQRWCIADGLGVGKDLEHARAVTALCAGLHDIGKVSGFQLCDARAREGSGPRLAEGGWTGGTRLGHDEAGMVCAAAVMNSLGFDDERGQGVVDRVAEIIGGHHGRFWQYEGAPAYGEPFLGGAGWARQRDAHAAAVFEAVGAPGQPPRFRAEAAVLVTGVVILADWLVSQEGYLRRRQLSLEDSLGEHFARSCREAEELGREAGLARVELERAGFAQAYGIAGEPNALQRSVMEELPAAVAERRATGGAGIVLVTAAPGDGKSESALEAERVLSAAFGTRGFTFALPTMATSDQMHDRVARALVNQGGAEAGLTLTHSMAWLSAAYAEEDLAAGQAVLVGEDSGAGAGDGPGRRRASPEQELMRPRRWLRGAKRPLLAQYAVGTVDQALMGVLPVRHNALRLLALSGKTFIVDEAHAYDPYMQVLLGRLLNWLGAYGVPVVLLSATLPVSVSDRLIKEYLRGAGWKKSELLGRSFKAPYPGWLYVDAATGEPSCISQQRRVEQAAERPMDLAVAVEPVVHGDRGGDKARPAVIARCLEPLIADRGCALLVCNTVSDAQQTYAWLRAHLSRRGLAPEDILLLHARFPGDVREARTREVTAGMGRPGPRPKRRIIVATQVVEQSLDLDADVVISDLAPLALLLQRAGRCWRHETHWARHGRPGDLPRPAWAAAPRLVVLDPLAGGGAVPAHWGEVYPEHLLRETSRVLAEPGRASIAIPADVQDLVEEVHGDRDDRYDWDKAHGWKAWVAHAGKEMAERSMGEMLAIPRARQVRRLADLHKQSRRAEDEWEAATRLAADAVRLLCVYQHPGGALTLDPAGRIPVPEPDSRGRMGIPAVRTLMSRTVPVPAVWFAGCADAHRPPTVWADHPMLSELLMLRQLVRAGEVQPVLVGGKRKRMMWLDEELGLVCQ